MGLSDQRLVGPLPIMRFDMMGGMDYDSRPHLVAPNKWRLLYNVRVNGGMCQIPRKKQALTVGGTEAIQALVNLPVGEDEYAFWMGLTPTKLYRLAEAGGTQVNATVFTEGARRWSTCVYNGRMWFVNEENRVRCSDGASIIEVWEHRRCHSKASGEELLGDGPFTEEPLYTGPENPEGAREIIGDVGESFTWTTGTHYRIYVKNVNVFEMYAEIEYYRVTGSGTSVTLSGIVTRIDSDYIVVRADNTVASVSNLDTDPPGIVRVTQMAVPAGRYVRAFFDHLVVGAPTYRGITHLDRVMWSSLRDFAQWRPGTENEADSYICTEYQRMDSVLRGVTGVELLGDLCLIFTPSCIYGMQYAGLPRVMRVDPLVPDYGNGLLYATVALDGAVAWYDVHHAGFYIYRGQGPEPVGAGIDDYFAEDVSSTYAQDTYAYVDRLNNEVLWVYKSQESSGEYDKAVAFNFRNKTWSVRSVENTHSFARVQKRAKTIAELSGTIEALTGTIEDLEQTSEEFLLLWGSANGVVLQEASSGDAVEDLLAADVPVMETGDLLYNVAGRVKEVHEITVNATASSWTGLQIEVSARESVDSSVAYVDVGTWTPTVAEKHLTFPTQAGKVLRYRFTGEGTVRDMVFSGFEANVINANASR